MKTEPQYGEPWKLPTLRITRAGGRDFIAFNEGDRDWLVLLKTNLCAEPKQHAIMHRCVEAYNFLAGHDLSTVTIVDNAVLEEVRAALEAVIHLSNQQGSGPFWPMNEVPLQAKDAFRKLSPEKK